MSPLVPPIPAASFAEIEYVVPAIPPVVKFTLAEPNCTTLVLEENEPPEPVLVQVITCP
jgi:hypothetical protein